MRERSLACELVSFLRRTYSLSDDAVMCLVGTRDVFAEPATDLLSYAIQVGDHATVGRLDVEHGNRFWQPQKMEVDGIQSLEIVLSAVDPVALGLTQELRGVKIKREKGPAFQSVTDCPAPWICQVRDGIIDFIASRAVEKSHFMLRFSQGFTQSVDDILRTGADNRLSP